MATPQETLSAYMRAFETLDPAQFLPYYNLPCLVMTPAGTFTATDSASAGAIASQFVQQARQQDYKRTEIVGQLESRALGAGLVLMSGVLRRINSKDQEVMRLGCSYMLRDSGKGWKIVAVSFLQPVA